MFGDKIVYYYYYPWCKVTLDDSSEESSAFQTAMFVSCKMTFWSCIKARRRAEQIWIWLLMNVFLDDTAAVVAVLGLYKGGYKALWWQTKSVIDCSEQWNGGMIVNFMVSVLSDISQVLTNGRITTFARKPEDSNSLWRLIWLSYEVLAPLECFIGLLFFSLRATMVR